MSIQRKSIPEPVQWDQAAILNAIHRMAADFSALSNLTENPTSDTRGVAVRNIRDYEILAGFAVLADVLERIQKQLSFITNIELDVGEGT